MMRLSFYYKTAMLTALFFACGSHPALATPGAARVGYLEYGTARKGKNLEVQLKVTGGHYGPTQFSPKYNRSRTASLKVTPQGEVSTMRYDASGSTGNVGCEHSGLGAGFLTAVAAKDRGVVLLDVRAGQFIQGIAPPQRDIFSLAQLRSSPAVKKAAKLAGLDPKTLEVKVSDAKLSSGYKSNEIHTLSFQATLSDASGKKHSADFSTMLEGNLAAGLNTLSLSGKLEHGVTYRWGWLYPPSIIK
jgi:hypothetical protein